MWRTDRATGGPDGSVRRSLAGEWERPPVNRRWRDERIRAWREGWLSDVERDVIRVEEQVRLERMERALDFEGDLEIRFIEAVAAYLNRTGVESTEDATELVPLEGRLKPLFHGREAVPLREDPERLAGTGRTPEQTIAEELDRMRDEDKGEITQ